MLGIFEGTSKTIYHNFVPTIFDMHFIYYMVVNSDGSTLGSCVRQWAPKHTRSKGLYLQVWSTRRYSNKSDKNSNTAAEEGALKIKVPFYDSMLNLWKFYRKPPAITTQNLYSKLQA